MSIGKISGSIPQPAPQRPTAAVGTVPNAMQAIKQAETKKATVGVEQQAVSKQSQERATDATQQSAVRKGTNIVA